MMHDEFLVMMEFANRDLGGAARRRTDSWERLGVWSKRRLLMAKSCFKTLQNLARRLLVVK